MQSENNHTCQSTVVEELTGEDIGQNISPLPNGMAPNQNTVLENKKGSGGIIIVVIITLVIIFFIICYLIYESLNK